MLKRKIYQTLLEWKANKKQETLLISGARQIGKTYIIRKFGKNNYKSYIEIDFVSNPELKEIFSKSLSPDYIYQRITSYLDVELIENDTLIFIDEIQMCENARTALKYLAIDDRYDVIASGSLLGLSYNKKEIQSATMYDSIASLPVGYERDIKMCPLDFEEYLWAVGVSENSISILKDKFLSNETIDQLTHEKFMKHLNDFLVVGGMPEVVNTFIETNNYRKAYEEETKIISLYKSDIQKYALNREKQKIEKCLNSIPNQLAKENHKFQYSAIERGKRRRDYESALTWIKNANYIKIISNVKLPVLPLKAYVQEESFRVYLFDIGLLTAMYGYETQKALLHNTFKSIAKGGIYENLVFDLLYKNKNELYFYKKEDSSQEIEFIFEKDEEVVPVEVKASRGATASLNSFISKYNPKKAYKLIDGNQGKVGNKITLPLYMAMFINCD